MGETLLTPDEVRDRLIERQLRLFHAIDLPEFETYCHEWALLSRAQVEASGGLKLAFYTDSSDKTLGIFDRCFGNLSRFSKLFWVSEKCIPNAYGHITLVFRTAAFSACSDVAVTMKTADKLDYTLATARVSEPMKLGIALAGREPGEAGTKLEFSTSTNRLSFDLLEEIIVQPVEVPGLSLLAAVEASLETSAGDRTLPPCRIEPLTEGNDEASARFQLLLAWADERKGISGNPVETLPASLKPWVQRVTVSSPLRPWCERTYFTLEALRKKAGPMRQEEIGVAAAQQKA